MFLKNIACFCKLLFFALNVKSGNVDEKYDSDEHDEERTTPLESNTVPQLRNETIGNSENTPGDLTVNDWDSFPHNPNYNSFYIRLLESSTESQTSEESDLSEESDVSENNDGASRFSSFINSLNEGDIHCVIFFMVMFDIFFILFLFTHILKWR